MLPRIAITDVEPVVSHGRYPAKATVGEPFPVRATVFREGHGQVGARVVLIGPDRVDRRTVPMTAHDNDAYEAWVDVDEPGSWSFRIESWADPYATWAHDAAIKIAADVDTALMLHDGTTLLTRAAAQAAGPDADVLNAAIRVTADVGRSPDERLAAATDDDVRAVLGRRPLREHTGCSPTYPFFVDRERALVGAWYEFFPRSEGSEVLPDGTVRTGTLLTAAGRLDAVAAMGFDVVYLPPIHPIGATNRKGPNNSLVAGPHDPGSPWAIGSAAGGHDTVNPDLGTLEDFDAFVARARELDLEVALDFALQCSPDHPWVRDHPEWFTHRTDGTIAYAENPPKKYQDIYPLDFDSDPDGLYVEIRRVLEFWISRGIRVFRVDNPHTKPLPFWERLLDDLRRTHPDVVLLAEAFTRPAMLRTLGMLGFHQSYTYFAWRTGKSELESYLCELSDETAPVIRPNLFVNTPDILTAYLQYGGEPAFRIRATIAAMAGPSWGMYAGFELYEHTAVRPGSEEYQDSEKYQIAVRDWAAAEATGTSLAPYVTVLNAIRKRHRALRQLRRFTLHATDDDAVLCFSKRYGDDVVIVVVTVDPHQVRETQVHLNMPELGLDWDATFAAYDEVSGKTWTWAEHNYVRLDPASEVAHIISVSSAGGRSAKVER